MTKFNKPRTIKENLASRSDATTNYEGELAFKLDPLTNLYIRAASSLVSEPKFYETEETADRKLINAIYEAGKVDPEFVLQLAVYCREQLYLRSVPLVMLVEMANNFPGEVDNSRKYVARTIQRADEITELLALQLKRNEVLPRSIDYISTKNSKARTNQENKNERVDKQTPIPMMIKCGIAKAFNKFNEYELAKYPGGYVKLKDALFISHPIPKDQNQQQLFNEIERNTLATPETWEVMRSTGKMTWHDVVNKIFYKNKRVNNYMAQIRNIWNILTDSSITELDIALLNKMLTDRRAVLNSKQFPYRFLSAYLVARDIESPYTNSVLSSLETACRISIENMPKLPGMTVIACDFSGSMNDPVGERPSSKKRRINYGEPENLKYLLYRCDIGQLLGMMANQFCEQSITGIFGDTWKVMPVSKYSSMLETTANMREQAGRIVGCSTNGYLVPQYLLQNNIKTDRIFLFTDCQMWDSCSDGKHFAVEFIKYQRKYPDVKLYTFDLSGYGTFMLPQDTRNVCLIGGFSDKIFDFIPAFEEVGKSNIIDRIKSIKV